MVKGRLGGRSFIISFHNHSHGSWGCLDGSISKVRSLGAFKDIPDKVQTQNSHGRHMAGN